MQYEGHAFSVLVQSRPPWLMASIQATAFFKLGPRPLNEHSLASVLDEDVKLAHAALNDGVKQHVSLLDFSLIHAANRELLRLQFSDANDGVLSPEMQKVLQDLKNYFALRCDELRLIALNWLKSVPPDASSEEFVGRD